MFYDPVKDRTKTSVFQRYPRIEVDSILVVFFTLRMNIRYHFSVGYPHPKYYMYQILDRSLKTGWWEKILFILQTLTSVVLFLKGKTPLNILTTLTLLNGNRYKWSQYVIHFTVGVLNCVTSVSYYFWSHWELYPDWYSMSYGLKSTKFCYSLW